MSLWSRLMSIFRAKANTALDRAEDPRETLDSSYQRQLELLQDVRRGVADVATARTRKREPRRRRQGCRGRWAIWAWPSNEPRTRSPKRKPAPAPSRG